MKKEYLAGKTLEELTQIVTRLGMPRFTAGQIASWLYEKRIRSIDEMTNLSKINRERLAQEYEIGYSMPVDEIRSVDGTVKYLFKTSTGNFIESVYIPDHDRATLCVSSQVGCKMNCYFCMTGKQGFKAQLTTREIINQVISIPESNTLTNIVFMGMGEPLDNMDAVMDALTILTAKWGFAWSPKRITVSTVGVKLNLQRFLAETDCHLAVSLHNPFPEERLSIMPVQKAFPIDEVITLLKEYDFRHQRRLSFEYIMFNGFNDSLKHAEALVRLLKGVDCRVNLIRFHAIPGVELKSSVEPAMVSFRDYLSRKGIICTIRTSRGEDIFAACGMLSTAKKRETGQVEN
ncbi:23S rRNA (adenine(2503)-C(2))-methyltransferase RlmN [Coprobacter sp.]